MNVGPTRTAPRPDLHSLTLNALIQAAPATLAVLGRHGLDTCCGGARTLEDACTRHGLDLETVVRDLEAAGA